MYFNRKKYFSGELAGEGHKVLWFNTTRKSSFLTLNVGHICSCCIGWMYKVRYKLFLTVSYSFPSLLISEEPPADYDRLVHSTSQRWVNSLLRRFETVKYIIQKRTLQFKEVFFVIDRLLVVAHNCMDLIMISDRQKESSAKCHTISCYSQHRNIRIL